MSRNTPLLDGKDGPLRVSGRGVINDQGLFQITDRQRTLRLDQNGITALPWWLTAWRNTPAAWYGRTGRQHRPVVTLDSPSNAVAHDINTKRSSL